MKNYIIADLSRIIKKKSLFITLFIFIASFFCLMFIVITSTFTGEQYLSYSGIFSNLFPLFAGIPIFLSIYNDDFKSKSMQVAIGYGVSRKKIILTKIIDTIILTITIGLVFGIVLFIVPLIFGIPFTTTLSLALLAQTISVVILVIGYTALSTIFLYSTENAIFGIIVFILLSCGSISMIVSLILGQNFIVNIIGDLSSYLFTNAVSIQAQNLVTLGHYTLSYIPILFCYIALPIIISMILFEKKELEF